MQKKKQKKAKKSKKTLDLFLKTTDTIAMKATVSYWLHEDIVERTFPVFEVFPLTRIDDVEHYTAFIHALAKNGYYYRIIVEED